MPSDSALQMRRGFGPSASIASCLLAWAAGVLVAEPVALQYAPVDGSTFLVTERLERQTVVDDREPVTDARERVSRLRIRESRSGYANELTVLSHTMARNGHPVASPVFAAMSELDLVQTLDGWGRLMRIEGYERLRSAMSSALPDQLARTLAPMVNADSLRLQDEAEYRWVYGEVTGATFEIGKPVSKAGMLPLPFAGQVPLHSVSVLERVDDGSGRLRLTSRCHSDPDALASEFESIGLDDLRANAVAMQAFLPENHTTASVQGSVVTLIDLAGVLVAEQHRTFDYTLGLSEPEGRSKTYRIRETRSYSAQPIPASGAGGQAE